MSLRGTGVLIIVIEGDVGAEEGQSVDEHADVDYGNEIFYSGYDNDVDGDENEVEDEDGGDLVFSASLPVLQVLLCVYLMFREVRKYLTLKVVMLPCAGTADSYLWLVGNGGMGYNYNYYYYHSSIPY